MVCVLPKAPPEFLLWLSISLIGRFPVHAISGFRKNFQNHRQIFEAILRVIGGFLYAARISLTRVSERIFGLLRIILELYFTPFPPLPQH
jgi:hypothetical protein